MDREERIDITIAGLAFIFTAGAYDYLEPDQTHGDIDNAHELFNNLILQKEIEGFFYKAKQPVHFTASELLIYHKFNPRFEKIITQGYTEESLQYLNSIIFFDKESVEVNLQRSILSRVKEKYGQIIENSISSIKQSASEAVALFMNLMKMPQLQPIPIGGASISQEIPDQKIFFNHREISVSIKNNEIFISREQFDEYTIPIVVFTIATDDYMPKTYPFSDSDPDGYVCKIEFDNDLQYGLITINNKES